MRKTFVAAASLLLMILHSPVARADGELPPPIVFVKDFLQLSEDQTHALMAMIQMREAALQPIAAQLHAKQEQLGKLVESPDADAATAGRLLIEIHAGEKQMNAAAHDAAESFENVLTQEQRERLQFLRQAAQIEPAIAPFRMVGLL